MNVLVMNPGGNSLKVQVVSCTPEQKMASEARELTSVMVEGIGTSPCLSVMQGKQTLHTEPFQAEDYGVAATNLLRWLKEEFARFVRAHSRRVERHTHLRSVRHGISPHNS